MFNIGQVVFVIYREKNSKGVHKWHIKENTEKIADIQERVSTSNKKKQERKFIYYRFASNPAKKYKSDQVFDSYESAEEQCKNRNHWNKYNPQSKGYKATHKNKFKKN